MVILHLCAPNAVSGGPRRCYVVYHGQPNPDVVAVVDEGFLGTRAISEAGYKTANLAPYGIKISASEYKRWIKIGEEAKKRG